MRPGAVKGQNGWDSFLQLHLGVPGFVLTGRMAPGNVNLKMKAMTMKSLIPSTLVLAALGAGLTLNLAAANLPAGYVDFGTFTPPGGGGQFVEVNANSNLLAMTARLARAQEPEIADLLGRLHHIRVNVIGLNDDNRDEIQQRVQKIHSQLDAPPWQRIVTVQEKDQDVRVYLRTRGETTIEGAAVTVLEGKKQAVFVNIVGDIKPEEIALLGERFDVDPLKKLGKAKAAKNP